MNIQDIADQPIEKKYMERAIRLATNGAGRVSPNPMVGAVITARGRIIGEGWHRAYGGPHAEVNAVNSVSEADQPLLEEATIYVTLEPCSHYGKTPPCSLLLIEKKIPRIVVGCADPFKEVSGRGIRMLREAGRIVVENFMEMECRYLNRRFITAHTLGRPWIQLKWARTANNKIAETDSSGKLHPINISSSAGKVLMHKERALADAIMTGVNTVRIDNPRLDNRLWPGSTPKKVTFRSENLPEDSLILRGGSILLDPELSLTDNLAALYRDHKVTSIMVEGGRRLLDSFLDECLYDEIRIETNPNIIVEGLAGPQLPVDVTLRSTENVEGNIIETYTRN